MPSSPTSNVLQHDKERRGVSNGRGRRAIAVHPEDTGGPSAYLSPSRLLSSFSSMGLRRERSQGNDQGEGGVKGIASWQECDLGDGQGKRTLLVTSTPVHALQIFSAAPSTIPDDPHVQESFPVPEEIISVPILRDDRHIVKSALPGITPASTSSKGASVVAARIIDRGPLAATQGPVVLMLRSGSKEDRQAATQSTLSIVSLRSGLVVQRFSLGERKVTGLDHSARFVVIATTDPSTSLLVLDSHTLQLIRGIPIQTLSSDVPPVFALSGRLLAYATSEAPHRPGPDGLGTLVTAKTLRARNRPAPGPGPGSSSSTGAGRSTTGPPSGVVLSSAIEIGGGVARGVWAGLKMGAQAAGRAGAAANQRLATSAPAPTLAGLESHNNDEVAEDAASESRSLDDDKSSILSAGAQESATAGASAKAIRGGQWIKIIDLTRQDDSTVAHFRLPRTKPFSPPTASTSFTGGVGDHAGLTVAHLAFSPDGTALFASPSTGRVFHLFDVRPSAPGANANGQNDVRGEAWHMYELRRGNTAATVSEVKWSADGRFLGVATQRGTVHVFPVHPSGGSATPASHVPTRLPNPTQLSPLSTVVTPSARIRPHHRAEAGETAKPSLAREDLGTSFTFQSYRPHPLRPGVSCLDLFVYRSALDQSDLARLSVRQVQSMPERQAPMTRRASALTDMMRARVGMNAASDLGVESAIKVTWQMPSPADDASICLPESAREDDNKIPDAPDAAARKRTAYAEIQTFSHDPRLLPPTIYLSHQIDYYDARPIDEYSRLSVIDREARTRRLHFRPEVVEVHTHSKSSTADAQAQGKGHGQSFDDALHSVMMDPSATPSPQLPMPGLPNGPAPTSVSWKKASIPIRQVGESAAAALQRGYAASRERDRRRRHSRSRDTDTGGNSLSFEDDTVLAMPMPMGEDQDHSGSSPLSSEMPRTDSDPEGRYDDDGDGEWAVSWEAEYARAVEDDGAPDDLVLGLMDEQEEERKRWVARQQRLAQEYAQKPK